MNNGICSSSNKINLIGNLLLLFVSGSKRTLWDESGFFGIDNDPAVTIFRDSVAMYIGFQL